MSRDGALLLADIIASCDAIATYVAGMDAEGFARDAKTCDAVVRRFEVIGEAVKGLSPELLAHEPDIPWRQIAGFRDILAHAYFAVEVSIIWDAASTKAPALRAACQRLAQR
jgi:uncharacterized protein with HEPN domain